MLRSMIISAMFALTAQPVLAGEAAEEVIETAAEQLSAGEFDGAALVETLSVDGIARFTLGKYARRIEAEELDRFTAAFERFLIEIFDAESQRFEGAEIIVEGSHDRNERDSIVLTQVRLPDAEPLDVRWRLIERNGEWRAVDVEIQGLWLAVEQRAQIVAILGESGATVSDAIDALGVDESVKYARLDDKRTRRR